MGLAAFVVMQCWSADMEPQNADLAREFVSLKAVCGKCHNLQIVMNTPRSLEDWRDTLQKMVDRGASGTDDQYDDVLSYLHRTMTTIDVNSADAEELATVLDVSADTAKSITTRRAVKKLTSLADLKAIPGVDASVIDAKARLIYFQ